MWKTLSLEKRRRKKWNLMRNKSMKLKIMKTTKTMMRILEKMMMMTLMKVNMYQAFRFILRSKIMVWRLDKLRCNDFNLIF